MNILDRYFSEESLEWVHGHLKLPGVMLNNTKQTILVKNRP